MIIPLAGLVLGAFLGVLRARAHGGKPADKVQWALVFGIIGFILGLFGLIFIDRLAS